MIFRRRDDAPEPVGGAAGVHELRPDTRSTQLATGTLACPRCDAPVALPSSPLKPADAIACPFCARAGAVRDFLTLGEPTRPARVAVRVVLPER